MENVFKGVRNGVKISLHFWVDYFVPSFFFKIGNYVDIMTNFKGKNRDKRSSQKCKVIFIPFLSSVDYLFECLLGIV